jgi:succinate dehydrogenase / fumarate reductase, flavoprotein subunit
MTWGHRRGLGAAHDPGHLLHAQAHVEASSGARHEPTARRPPSIPAPRSAQRPGQRSNFELYSWLFMRVSGIVLVFLVLGHLLIMNILDGGVQRINFAFVAGRWSSPFWQIWDLLHAVAGHAARHQRHAHDHQRLRRARPDRFWLKMLLYVASVFIILPGHAGDLHLRPEHRLTYESAPGEAHHADHRYDVVIVGAGGAGMRAALEAGKRARTAVLTKLYPTRSHTGAAQGGMCAALANVEEDNWEWHTFDTVKGGDYLVDQDAAEVMCKEAIDAVLDLEKMGLPFNRTPEGRIDQRRFGGHTRNHGEAAVRRACYAADRTGHMILQTLYQKCIKQGVEFFNEFYVLDLLLNEVDGDPHRRRRGLRAGHRRDPRLPGQVGHLRHRRLRQGLQDHLQRAHPHRRRHGHRLAQGPAAGGHGVLPVPPDRPGRPGVLLTEGARGEGGILRNASASASWSATPRPSRTSPRATWSPGRWCRRCARAAAPGPNKDYVYLDLTHLPPEQIEAKLPDITEFARTYLGVDPSPSWCRSSPPRTTRWAASRPTSRPRSCADNEHVIPGLYAAGECACVSVHGANRLGTNSLLDINVFGRRAGIAAAEYAARRLRRAARDGPGGPGPGRAAALGTGGERVGAIRREMQETMDINAQVYRTEATLKQALRRQALQARYRTSASRTRASGTTPTCSRPSSWASCSTWPRCSSSGRWPQGVARRARPRGLPEPRRRQLHAPHDGLPRGGPGRRGTSAWTTSPSSITRYQPMERKY